MLSRFEGFEITVMQSIHAYDRSLHICKRKDHTDSAQNEICSGNIILTNMKYWYEHQKPETLRLMVKMTNLIMLEGLYAFMRQ